MRISDWSSDVCSSDLKLRLIGPREHVIARDFGFGRNQHGRVIVARAFILRAAGGNAAADLPEQPELIRHVAADRKTVARIARERGDGAVGPRTRPERGKA